jgi:hypothetical protein
MKARCRGTGRKDYPYYGGRGITVCDAWRQDFQTFLRDMGRCPPGLTLDRIDVDGPYAPGNCRWATWREQRANVRKPLRDLDDQGLSYREAAHLVAMSVSALWHRFKRAGVL